MRIHKEGYFFVGLMGVIFLVLLGVVWVFFRMQAWGWIVLGIWVLLGLWVAYFFRTSDRKLPKGAVSGDIYAPADGKVVEICRRHESECFKREMWCISIFLSVWNRHSTHSPVAGEVTYFCYHPGKYLLAWHPKSSFLNEHTTMVLNGEGKDGILVRQIAGWVARRICFYVKKGDRLDRGQLFGFIRFGSRVDIFLPLHAQLCVTEGESVRALRTCIARFSS